uniref:tRNA intron endonuclease catalytic domain-containing protein n=1 Tax=Fervidicoccus fontis TaxID=683846 RepID=A0A7J3ZL91_9CREN
MCKLAVYHGGETGECIEKEKEIDVYQLAYSCKKGGTKVVGPEGRELTWFDIIKLYSKDEPRAWIMFSVYYDLKERGRVVKRGPHKEGFTLYRGDKPVANVFVLEETVQFKISKIIEWLDYSRRQQRDLIIAIVDKHGDTSYYMLESFD